MNNYLELVSQYAKIHKKKNRLTLMCITISVMLVAAIFGLADMSIKANINEEIRKNGNYHAMLQGISEEIAQQISYRNEVTVSGWITEIEDGIFQENTIVVMGGDEMIASEMNLKVEQGSFPSSPQEALIDRQTQIQHKLEIGDSISVSLADNQIYQYSISGIYDDFASLRRTDRHSLFLSREGIKDLVPLFDNTDFFALQFRRGTNIRRALNAIKNDYNLLDEQVVENTILLGLMGQSDNSSMFQLYLMAGILFILVLTAGTFMISSSFNMGIQDRIQFFGLLRCIGATKKQIKRYVRLEGLRFCLFGIPTGLILGCVIMWTSAWVLRFLNLSILPDMPLFQISFPGLLGGAVTGFLAVMLASRSPAKTAAKVPPTTAVTGNTNQSNKYQIKNASRTKLFHVDIAIGVNHAFSNKKNILLMTGSFAISIILFLCFTILITFVRNAIKPLQPYAPDISVIESNRSDLLDRSLFDELQALPDVKNIYGRMFYYDIPATYEQGHSNVTLLSYEKKQFEWAQAQLSDGDISSVENGDGVLVVYSDEYRWKTGDKITIHLPDGERELSVAGILSHSPFDAAEGSFNMICSEPLFTDLTGISQYSVIDIQVKADISNQVRNLSPPNSQILDKQLDNRNIRSTFNSMMVFVYGFLFIIALVALINIVNTVNTSVSNRINQYGIMRAVGMSYRQLNRMIASEAASYALTGSIAGGILGLLLHRLLFQIIIESIWGQTWQPPFQLLLIIILATLLTTWIAVILPFKKIKELSIVSIVNSY